MLALPPLPPPLHVKHLVAMTLKLIILLRFYQCNARGESGTTKANATLYSRCLEFTWLPAFVEFIRRAHPMIEFQCGDGRFVFTSLLLSASLRVSFFFFDHCSSSLDVKRSRVKRSLRGYSTLHRILRGSGAC